MIPQDFISEWKQHAPWPHSYQVEQDLIISRALVEIFNHPLLADSGYDFHKAANFIMNQLAPLIPGEPWQGKAPC